MKIIHYLFVLSIFSVCHLAYAGELIGPSESANGAFTVSWEAPLATLGCSDATITASSNAGYEDIFSVEVQKTSFEFFGLPDGHYTISLTGICDKGKSTLIAARSVSVGGSITDTVPKSTKSLAPSVSLGQTISPNSAVSATSTGAGTRCGTYCPTGTHSEGEFCNDQVSGNNGLYERCYNLPNTLCYQNPIFNSTFCQTDTTEFWTCGFTCPSGYNKVDQISGSSRCRVGSSGYESRCVLNTSPPASVTLSGPTSRSDARVVVSLSSVKHATRYEWKFSTGSSWSRVSNREVSVSGLIAGTYTVQVRACNSYGCSATSSRTVTLSVPVTPVITSAAASSEEVYTLAWTYSDGASRYEWTATGGERWGSVTGTSVTIPAYVGTKTYQVRACNPAQCSAASSPKIVTISLPAAPTILSHSTHYVGNYLLTWTVSPGATRYEYKGNNSDWWETTGTSRGVPLVRGNNTVQVRACNLRGCGIAASKIVNSSINTTATGSCPVINIGMSCSSTSSCVEAFGRACASAGGRAHSEVGEMVCRRCN